MTIRVDDWPPPPPRRQPTTIRRVWTTDEYVRLSSPYKFKQPPDHSIVAGLVAAALDGSLHDGLGSSIIGLRGQLADARSALHRVTPDDHPSVVAYRVAILRDLARASEQLRECEAAVDIILAFTSDGPALSLRCDRCHQRATAGVHTSGRRVVHAHGPADRRCAGSGDIVGGPAT